MDTYSDYEAAVKQYDPEVFLGRLAWYSISESSHIDHGKFCGVLVDNGLSSHLPPVPRSSDVFKRACTAAQRKKVPTAHPKVFINYLVREVGKDSDNVWRRLVAEQVDTEGHKLGYTELVELHFYRPTSKITVTVLPEAGGALDDTARAVVETIEKLFVEWDNSLTPYSIRELIRKILTGMNATVVRPSGGVYFVRQMYAEQIEAMERAIATLPGGSSLHSLPLVDDSKQRAMLRQAFEDESIGAIDGLLGEISVILKSGTKITSDRFAQFKSEYDGLKKKVVDYSDLLDVALAETGSRLEIMNDALFQLLGRVKV